MKLYRRGNEYLIYIDMDRCFVYDSEAGTASRDFDPAKFIRDNGNDGWKHVREEHGLPEGLVKHLIVKLPSR